MNRLMLCLAGLTISTTLTAAQILPGAPALSAAPDMPSLLGTLPAPGALTPPPLNQVIPALPNNTLISADLLALTQTATGPVTKNLPALPTTAPCRFGGASIELNFGQIPAGVDARRHAQQLMLQVECSQATEFTISSQEPSLSIGSAAERSAIAVTLRSPTGIHSGAAWALLEQDGQPLAMRRFSVPAASPTLIAVTALLLASPQSRLTPSLHGELESLMLARQLYLIEATTP